MRTLRPTPSPGAGALPSLAALALAALLGGCSSSTPAPACPAGQTSCSGACFDLSSSEFACGVCGNACASGASCLAGVCTCPAATPDLCGGPGGQCVDLQTDDFHCGACSVYCGLGSCTGGACACQAGTTSCAGDGTRCVDLTNDTGNCGTCRNGCALGELCVSGSCQCVGPDHLVCNGACLDVRTDEANCGACGHRCPTGATCTGGACACPAATPNLCGSAPGVCVDLATDRENCHGCGNRCPTGAACTAAGCTCPAGKVVCGTNPGACVDPTTDAANCGACGRTCTGTCLAGSCCAAPSFACSTTCCTGGDACCAGASPCQPAHTAGLPPVATPGGAAATYYACDPLNTRSLANAQAAARAWSPTGTAVDPSPACGLGCYGWQLADRCAVWCTAGSNHAGQVYLETIQNVCLCNTPVGTWN